MVKMDKMDIGEMVEQVKYLCCKLDYLRLIPGNPSIEPDSEAHI